MTWLAGGRWRGWLVYAGDVMAGMAGRRRQSQLMPAENGMVGLVDWGRQG